MTTALNVVNSGKRRKSELFAEEVAAVGLVKLAEVQGLSLTGSDGLLKQFAKNVLENEELTEHLGYERNRAEPGRQGQNVCNGTRPPEGGAD